MANSYPSFFARLAIAFGTFFRLLGSGAFAARVQALEDADVSAERPSDKGEPEPAAPVLREANEDAALQLLAILQREGRFVDFLQEDMASFSDAQIGAAARVVHEGCRKALRSHLQIEPIQIEDEGSQVEVAKDYDATAIRVVGNPPASPPYRGRLQHRGWRVANVTLPQLTAGHNPTVLAPAEIEVS